MLKFTEIGAGPPRKRAAAARSKDGREIYQAFAPAEAGTQASRCAQCGVPFCQDACPLQNNIPDWLKLAAENRLEEAYALSASTNPMPEVCGRICPQDRLCEQACVLEQSEHSAVTIGAVEKFLTDTAWERGWVAPIKPGPDRGQSIGIIGAGPAGLAAAERMRALGYAVTVYDRHDRVGGLMIYGIPSFKLDKAIMERRTARLIAGGISFKLNCNVGDDISFETLRQQHDAVLIATGVYRPRPLGVDGQQVAIAALDYLTASNKLGLGDAVEAAAPGGQLNASGKRVVVIGGGDTAMDCVRTAIRQNAESVICLYRRDRANMPGSLREVACAEEEGVTFEWLAQPMKLVSGKATAVEAVRMRLGPADASGRQSPVPVQGSEFVRSADMVIAALGFDPEDLPALWRTPQLERRSNGALRVGATTLATSLPGVFAAGDVVRGASLVVWALRDGLDAANSMHAWLSERLSAASVAAE